MIVCPFIFVLDVSKTTGESLGRYRVTPSFEAAVECLRFGVMRHTPATLWSGLAVADTRVYPRFAATPPYVDGVRLELLGTGGQNHEHDLGLELFHTYARAASAKLVKAGQLQEGEAFHFNVLAFEQTEPPAKPAPFQIEAVPSAPPLLTGDLEVLIRHSQVSGQLAPADVPVFVPRRILAETAELTTRAGAVETGGMLVARLIQDARAQEVGVLMTAQIPATHTEAQCESLTFTPETFNAANAVLTLRDQPAEQLIGWWHSHPSKAWCKDCPEERRRLCALQQDFLSAHDLNVQQTLFPRAYQVALLQTNSDAGMRHTLFGWRHGTIGQRGFYVLDEAAEPAAVPA